MCVVGSWSEHPAPRRGATAASGIVLCIAQEIFHLEGWRHCCTWSSVVCVRVCVRARSSRDTRRPRCIARLPLSLSLFGTATPHRYLTYAYCSSSTSSPTSCVLITKENTRVTTPPALALRSSTPRQSTLGRWERLYSWPCWACSRGRRSETSSSRQ